MLPFFDLGLPQGRAIYVLPVPFEGAVSFGTGTCLGPEALFRASVQIESYDAELDLDLGDLAHFLPLPFIDLPEAGPQEIHAAMRSALVHLDLHRDFVLTLGGDHSVPLPLFALYQRAYPDLVILHIDAHADLRPAYEGSPYSHACIMARARDLGLPVVQLGIRSVCREQMAFMRAQNPAELCTLFAWDLASPDSAATRVLSFVADRPLYISFDVDGMDPGVIPGTGTPEPGGIGYGWIMDFFVHLWRGGAGPRLVGMDMCELAPLAGSQVSETAAVKLLQRIFLAWLGQ